jgi:hypothetical protein
VPEPLCEEHFNSPLGDRVPDWPLLVDLDGDGRPEIVVRQADFSPRFYPPSRSTQWLGERPVVETVGVRVLDGATGEVRWSRALGRSRSDDLHTVMPFRLLAGPAPTDGGSRELYVASLVVRWQPGIWRRPELYVDALSGQDGNPRWWWSQPLGEEKQTGLWGHGLGKLAWWQPGPGTEPLPLVPLNCVTSMAQRPLIATFALAGASGELRHTIPELTDPQTADLDGDGRPELFGWVEADQTVRRLRGWQPIRGTTPALIAEAQRWKPAKRWVIRVDGGSYEEVIPEPVLPPREQPQDQRRAIPLPWERQRMIGNFQQTDLSEIGGPTLLVTVPFLVLLIPLALVIEAFRKRPSSGGPAEAARKEQARARKRWWRRWSLAHAGVALFLVLGTGAVWLALDRELAPGERYYWGRWYLLAGGVFAITVLVLMACSAPFLLARAVLRRALRRKAS